MLAAVFLLTCGRAGLASAAASVELGEVNLLVPGYLSGVTADMPTADFDGDGLPDVVALGGLEYSNLIQIIGFEPGSGWRVKQSFVPNSGGNGPGIVNLVAWAAADGAHLAFLKNRLLNVYAGWPLAFVRQIQFDSSVDPNDIQVADVDNDGVVELLVASSAADGSLLAYSLTTGDPLWSIPHVSNYNSSLLVAQLDADPALEILLGGSPGVVVDGATHAVEWQYPDGFGWRLHSGRFGGMAPRFASVDYDVRMFQSQPWTRLWEMGGINANSSTVADVDGDGTDELICGSNAIPRGIRVIDSQSHAIRSSFDGIDSIGIAGADFDGDGQVEIAIGLGSRTTPPAATSFRVINAATGVAEYSVPILAPGPYVAGAFIADGGTTDLIFGSASGLDYAGTITRSDALTGAIRWRSAAGVAALDLKKIRNVVVTQLAGQASPVVLASGSGESSNPYSGRIVALNADTGAPLWSIDSTSGALPDSVTINGLAAIDLNGDAITDSVLACTSERRLRLFDAASQAPIWSSVVMSGDCKGAFSMTSAGTLQFVAVISGALRAYDAQSHLLSWSLPDSILLEGATYLPQGVDGPELALYSTYGVSFYDAETRQFLREFEFNNMNPVEAVAQPAGSSIHELLVAINDRLHVVDGETGEVRASSAALGMKAGRFNQLAVRRESDGTYLVGTGSDVAVFTHRLGILPDMLFADGFEPAMR